MTLPPDGTRSPSSLGFLRDRACASPLAIGAGVLYLWSAWPEPTGNWYSFALIALWIALQPVRPPRALSWLVLLTGFAVHVRQLAIVEAAQPIFRSASRDMAVIDSVRALAAGHNPWSFVNTCVVTTGPASILALTPPVLLFGDLKFTAVAFWVVLGCAFAMADLLRRSDRATALPLLLMLDRAGFPHQLHWRLDELYFPMLLLIVAFLAMRARWMRLAGVAIAIAPLCRVNYAFLALAVMLWGWWSLRPSRQELVRFLAAGALAAAVVVLPFVVVGRMEFFRINALTTAMSMGQAANQGGLAGLLAPYVTPTLSFLIRSVLTLAGIGVAAYLGRQATQPFWLVTFASLLAHTVAWAPVERRFGVDYVLMIVLPALLGAAFAGTPARQHATAA